MTGPEQHAATVGAARARLEARLAPGWKGNHPDSREQELDRAALDELVALAGRADEQAQAAMDNYNWGATNLERAEAAEARADDLQRERSEWQEKLDAKTIQWHRLYSDLEQARREADQLRAALQFYADDANYRLSLQDAARGRNQPVIDDDGHRARAALAGVQADNKDSA